MREAMQIMTSLAVSHLLRFAAPVRICRWTFHASRNDPRPHAKTIRRQDDEEFIPGDGVDELVQSLEEGEPLPPDPRYEGLELESTEQFTARLEKLRHAYEAQFLDRKDWKASRLLLANLEFPFLFLPYAPAEWPPRGCASNEWPCQSEWCLRAID